MTPDNSTNELDRSADEGGAGAPPEVDDRNRAPAGVTRIYESNGIRIFWTAERCVHAAECVAALSDVFDPRRRPWVQLGDHSADELAAAVERCPTGALRYQRTDGGPQEEVPAQTTIKTLRDGPHLLRGDIEIRMSDGTVRQETRVALCRCGQSQHMPFCDNSHRATRFRDPR